MANFYANLQKTAARLLTSKGAKITFTRQVETAFDATTGAKTYSDFTFTGYGAKFDYKSSEIDGEIIKRGDARLLLEKTEKEPDVGDSAKIGDIKYRVMDVKTVSPADTIVMYECRLRK